MYLTSTEPGRYLNFSAWFMKNYLNRRTENYETDILKKMRDYEACLKNAVNFCSQNTLKDFF